MSTIRFGLNDVFGMSVGPTPTMGFNDIGNSGVPKNLYPYRGEFGNVHEIINYFAMTFSGLSPSEFRSVDATGSYHEPLFYD